MKEEEQEKPEKKTQHSGGGAFIGYAVFVFTVLAVGLYVILVRSKG